MIKLQYIAIFQRVEFAVKVTLDAEMKWLYVARVAAVAQKNRNKCCGLTVWSVLNIRSSF